MSLKLIGVPLSVAKSYVHEHHRHHIPSTGHMFSLGAVKDGSIVGVAMVGRPVARGNDDGATLEVTRLASNGSKNVCSFLYGAARASAFAINYPRLITYTLAPEPGASLRAAGFTPIKMVRGRSWSCPSRPRTDKHPTENKVLWEAVPALRNGRAEK